MHAPPPAHLAATLAALSTCPLHLQLCSQPGSQPHSPTHRSAHSHVRSHARSHTHCPAHPTTALMHLHPAHLPPAILTILPTCPPCSQLCFQPGLQPRPPTHCSSCSHACLTVLYHAHIPPTCLLLCCAYLLATLPSHQLPALLCSEPVGCRGGRERCSMHLMATGHLVIL